MTVDSLKNKLEFYANHGHSNDVVVIELKEPSIGGIACTGIKHISSGFDWDNGKIIITCDDAVLRYKKDRDVPQSAVRIIYTKYPNTRPVIHCPICENKLRKDDKYCSRCGQAISMDNLREFRI